MTASRQIWNTSRKSASYTIAVDQFRKLAHLPNARVLLATEKLSLRNCYGRLFERYWIVFTTNRIWRFRQILTIMARASALSALIRG